MTVPSGPVTTNINFFVPPADGSQPYLWTDTPDDPAAPEKNYTIAPQPTTIHDARGRESTFTLDRDAFRILQNLPPSREESFTDDASIKANYYPEVERLLLDSVEGADKVYIFDHTIRRQERNAPRGPVQYAHVDQTHQAVVKRVRRYYAPDQASALLAGRYRIVNVWRTLNRAPLESLPIAYASAASAADEDFCPVELRYPEGYRGETAAVKHNQKHEWWYLSGMTGDERVLLECFDSESLKEGSAVKGRVPHSAFEDPRTREDAEERMSIEVRALVFG